MSRVLALAGALALASCSALAPDLTALGNDPHPICANWTISVFGFTMEFHLDRIFGCEYPGPAAAQALQQAKP